MTLLDLRDEPYDGPTAQILIAEVQQEYVVRYGGPDTTPVDVREFAPPRGRFLVGYLDVQPVAMGGIRLVAGDVADRIYKQAVTAAGSGCAAAMDEEKYLSEVESGV